MSDPIWSLIAGNAAAKASSSTSGSQVKQPDNGLNKDAFMRLLLTQMQSQDPLSPMDGQAFFAQLSQLSLLEQMYELNDTLNKSQAQQQMAQAGTLIGRTIEGLDSDGAQVSGIVQGVKMSNNQIFLDVNGAQVPLGSVTSVRA